MCARWLIDERDRNVLVALPGALVCFGLDRVRRGAANGASHHRELCAWAASSQLCRAQHPVGFIGFMQLSGVVEKFVYLDIWRIASI
jgi:hypothetical protein